MDAVKRRRLERKGWTVGSADDFLGLTGAESAVIEVKLALRSAIRERRRRQNVSQEELACRMGSSQPRVAAMEAGDPEASIDLLIRALLELGATRAELAAWISAGHSISLPETPVPDGAGRRQRISRARQKNGKSHPGPTALPAASSTP